VVRRSRQLLSRSVNEFEDEGCRHGSYFVNASGETLLRGKPTQADEST
jgi:hypothetical protein